MRAKATYTLGFFLWVGCSEEAAREDEDDTGG